MNCKVQVFTTRYFVSEHLALFGKVGGPHSSCFILSSPTHLWSLSHEAASQKGGALRKEILSPRFTKSCQRLIRPSPFHRQCPTLGPKHGVWLPAKSFIPKGKTAQERWPSGNNLPGVPLATHFVDFLKCVSYGVSVSFLAGFVTLLHCLFLVIWPNTLVFI